MLLDPRSKDEKKKSRDWKNRPSKDTKDFAPATAEEETKTRRRNRNRDRQKPPKGGEADAAPAPAAKAKAEPKAKAKAEAKPKAKDAVNAKKGTPRSQKAPPILVKHKTKNGKEVTLNVQNECGYLAHGGQGKCFAHEEKPTGDHINL